MNAALYGFGPEDQRQWILVDCGMGFGGEEHLPGIDLVYPDLRFIEEERENLLGIFITHAHEDHIGALVEMWPRLRAPVYATRFALSLLETRRLSEPGAPKVELRQIAPGQRLKVGPFDIEFLPVAHSIPESNALAIRTPLGLVVHTGDWKLDDTPYLGSLTSEASFRALGEEGVLALVCNSTNVVRDGISPSEADVSRHLGELIREAPHRVAVTTFASNVARMRSVADAARQCGREVVVVGRAMDRVADVARECGYLDNLPEFRPPDSFGYFPRDKVVAMLTGSQGEPRAALARIAQKEHPDIALSPGDRVIFSSRAIPGNEKAISTIINSLIDQGIEIITDRNHLVHVSGHPRRDELARMYQWTRPRIAIPAHGEPLHLTEHAAFARKQGVSEVVEARNGTMVRLAPGPAKIIDDVPAGRLYKDGDIVISSPRPCRLGTAQARLRGYRQRRDCDRWARRDRRRSGHRHDGPPRQDAPRRVHWGDRSGRGGGRPRRAPEGEAARSRNGGDGGRPGDPRHREIGLGQETCLPRPRHRGLTGAPFEDFA